MRGCRHCRRHRVFWGRYVRGEKRTVRSAREFGNTRTGGRPATGPGVVSQRPLAVLRQPQASLSLQHGCPVSQFLLRPRPAA